MHLSQLDPSVVEMRILLLLQQTEHLAPFVVGYRIDGFVILAA
jgi:hypothetical protein